MFCFKNAEIFAIFCQILLLTIFARFKLRFWPNVAGILPEFCRNLPDNGNFAGNQKGTEKLEQKLERKKLES